MAHRNISDLIAEGEHQGPTTRKMTAREIKMSMKDYMSSSFDSKLAYNFSYPDDLDWEKFYEWQQKTGLRHAKDPDDVFLELEAASETSEGLIQQMQQF